MKKNVCAILFFCLLIGGVSDTTALAADYNQLSQSDADRQTLLNNITDFFATAGKSPDDKKRTIKERKAIRKEERLRNQRRKRDVSSQKQMRKQQKVIMDKVNAVNEARHQKKKK